MPVDMTPPPFFFSDHVLDSTLEDLTMYTRNRIMLIEAKRDKQMVMDSMPEAISQAIALSEVTGCVFNYIFALLERERHR